MQSTYTTYALCALLMLLLGAPFHAAAETTATESSSSIFSLLAARSAPIARVGGITTAGLALWCYKAYKNMTAAEEIDRHSIAAQKARKRFKRLRTAFLSVTLTTSAAATHAYMSSSSGEDSTDVTATMQPLAGSTTSNAAAAASGIERKKDDDNSGERPKENPAHKTPPLRYYDPPFLELSVAVRELDADRIRKAISRGAKPNEVYGDENRKKDSYLVQAIRQGEAGKLCVQELIKHIDVNTPTTDGILPIHEAINTGVPALVNLILPRLTTDNRDGLIAFADNLASNAPPHLRGNFNTIIGLLTSESTEQVPETDFRTPLDNAIAQGNTNAALVIINETNADDPSLQCSPAPFGSPISVAAETGNVAVLEALLAKGISPNSPGNIHDCPLARAIANRHVPAIRCLLAAGADTAAFTANMSMFCHAVASGNDEIIRLIGREVAKTRDLNVPIDWRDKVDCMRDTLQYAVLSKQKSETIYTLLELGLKATPRIVRFAQEQELPRDVIEELRRRAPGPEF